MVIKVKVALYLRVSTKEQTENYSLDGQEEKLKAFAKAKGWEVFDVYKDGGFSGADIDRPDLNRMLTDIKHKKINAVMVYKLDRLSRSQRDTLELIEDHFLKNDVDFISVTETLDTTTPMGRAMIGIMSAFAQLERELIAERMRDGQIKRAEAGYATMGGDHDPAGFKRQDGELITKENEKKHIQKAFELYAQYHSITIVQQELKKLGYPVWRFRRYRDILENPLYNGKFTFAEKVYEGKHEKLIDDKLFNVVQDLLKRHRGHNFHKAKESLLSGLITCSQCGERYLTYTVYQNVGGERKKYRYYICRARRFPAEYNKKCMNKNWNAKKIEEIIGTELQALKIEKEKVEKEKPNINYDKLIKNIDQKIARLIDLYADGQVDKNILDSRIKRYNEEKEQLISQKEAHTSDLYTFDSKDIENHVISLSLADFETRRAILEKLIHQIYTNDGKLSIEWTF